MQTFKVFVCSLLCFPLILPASGQQTILSVQRDAQAITLLSQVISASGGMAVVTSLRDFAASGGITYYWAGTQVHNTATLRARGIRNFRLDANLPDGTQSWVAVQGKGSVKGANGTVTAIPRHNTMHLVALSFPAWKIANALSDTGLALQYTGAETFSGQQVNVVHVQLPVDNSADPGGIASHLSGMDFLIDTATYQVVGIRDAFHPAHDSTQDVMHEIAFSDFREVNGCLVPFSISERVGGQETWAIQLSAITFNVALTDSDFVL
jgi:hypothetical protein